MKRIAIPLFALCVTLIIFGSTSCFSNTSTHTQPKTELVLYQWDKVDVLTAEPKLDAMLAEQRVWIKERLSLGAPYTWENFVLPLSDMDESLRQFWFPIAHLSKVLKPEDNALRERQEIAYAKCEEKITRFGVEVGQNKDLYKAYKVVSDGAQKASLSSEQKMSLENTLRDYRLSGIDLPDQKKQELKQIAIELASLSKKFSNNIVNSTDSWKKPITKESALDGIPDSVKVTTKEAAVKLGSDGYVLDIQDSTVGSVLGFAKDRELRKEILKTVLSVASANGPGGDKFDNTPVVERILELRYREAKLLGFNNYAEMALSTRMAENTNQVMDFLNDLKVRSRPFAEKEFAELSEFARIRDGLSKLEQWDMSYYSQLLKKEKFSFSEKDMRPYFPLTKVVGGLDKISNKLYGISLKERSDVSVWHPSVKFYEVYKNDSLIGGVYMDLFQRSGKSGGGWANFMAIRYQKGDGSLQLPVSVIVLNFRSPEPGGDALLNMQEVLELFHEFGHNTQHFLTQVTTRDVSGTSGVPWDGVEVASQFMENFAWQPEALNLFASHYQTGEKLPAVLLEKAREMRMFGKGLSLSRQLILGMFDFRLHMNYVPEKKGQAGQVFEDTSRELSMTEFYPSSRTYPNSFEHIFAGGYSAGYYSYLWAEVLSADDFSPFMKNEKIDWSVGKKFEDELLSRGGSRSFMESNTAFLGRKPSVDSLMKQYGFVK